MLARTKDGSVKCDWGANGALASVARAPGLLMFDRRGAVGSVRSEVCATVVDCQVDWWCIRSNLIVIRIPHGIAVNESVGLMNELG